MQTPPKELFNQAAGCSSVDAFAYILLWIFYCHPLKVVNAKIEIVVNSNCIFYRLPLNYIVVLLKFNCPPFLSLFR